MNYTYKPNSERVKKLFKIANAQGLSGSQYLDKLIDELDYQEGKQNDKPSKPNSL